MPKAVKSQKPDDRKREETKKLHQLGYGETFRFPDISYHEAMSGKDEAVFYSKVKYQPEKTGKAYIVSNDGLIVREVDDFHTVVPHASTLIVEPAKMV